MSTTSASIFLSQRAGFLRALAAKARRGLAGLTVHVRVVATRAGSLAASAANAALGVASTHAGYNALTTAVRAVVSTGWRIVKAVGGWFARAACAVGRAVTGAVSMVSPTLATTISSAARRWVADPVAHVAHVADTWISTAGEIIWALARTPLVRTVTVRTAQVVSTFLGINALTHGWLAARIVQALPWAMDAVLALTTPWKALAVVAGAGAAAMGLTIAQLFTSTEPEPAPQPAAPRAAGGAHTPVPSTSPATQQPDPLDAEQIAAQVTVEVNPDGSLTVHGIPSELTPEQGRHVADLAARAAEKHLERILTRRRQPTRDDRRLLTKVAREAIRNTAPQHA